MPAAPDDVDRLLAEAGGLPDGPARVALCEEAARVADTRGDVDKGFAAKLELIKAANWGGRPDVMHVAFAWVLATLDRHPGRFTADQTTSVLWHYKWVVPQLADYPQVPKAQVLDLLGDMAARYRAAGSTLHAVYHKERAVYRQFGELGEAAAAHERMQRTPRDHLSDCPACVHDGMIGFHASFGRYEEAVAAAEPILAGRLSCATVPERTYAQLLRPLVLLGRLDEAMRHHRRGFPAADGKPALLSSVGDHVEFLALTGHWAKAVRAAERHLPAVLAFPAPSMRREWFPSLRLLFGLIRDSGQKSVTFRWPADHPMKTANDRTTPAALYDWFDAESRALAAAFDARNGNTYYARRLEEHAALARLAARFPPGRAPTPDGSHP